MQDEGWGEVWRVFESACELPSHQRKAFVESALPDSAAASRVFSMLDEMEGNAPDSVGATPVAEIPDDQLEIGSTVGRFNITEFLGRGGMGEVYAAADPELDRTVALKVLRTGHIGTRGGVERFIQEARAASALNHPGIVTVYEVLRAEPLLAIVMELIEGVPLRNLTGKPLPVRKVAEYGRQIARALQAAHERGIVHRDIKPENIMRREDDLVKVLDFGLARHVTERAIDELPLGTLGYMSPEQLRGGPLTGATDIFSLGVVLFELAMGKHPFLAGTSSETTRAIAMLEPGTAAGVPNLGPIGNRALEELIRAMLSKDPAVRPGASTVAEKLAAIETRLDRRIPTRTLVLAAGLVAALLGVAWWEMRQSGRGVTAKPPRVSHFTNLDGSENDPSFSPDGKKIVFSWTGPDGSNTDIYYQEVGADAPIRLTENEAEDSHPVWSPDGRSIAFLRRIAGESQPQVVVIPAAGGKVAERYVGRILDTGGFHGPLAWWPDGKSLIVRDDANGTIGLVRLDIASGAKHPLTFPPGSANDRHPMPSLDGKSIAFIRQKSGSKSGEICLLPTDGEPAKCILTTPELVGMAWWDHGRSIVYSDRDNLWQVAIQGDVAGTPSKWAAVRIDTLAGDPAGHRLAGELRVSDTNIWRAEPDGKRSVKLLSSSMPEGDSDFSPDGEKIVFRSERTGSYELWTSDKDGGHLKRLTHFGGELGSARWSPDGKSIVFDGFRPSFDKSIKKTNLFVVPAEGGPLRRLTDDRYMTFVPNWSHDGKWIYFIREDGSTWETWKVPSDGDGAPVRVSTTGMFDIAESSDGKYLYYNTPRGAKGIWRRPVDGGDEVLLKGTEQVQLYRYCQLTDKGIYFVDGPTDPVVQLLNLATGKVTRLPVTLADFHKGGRGLSVSRDGVIIYTRTDLKQSDILLIEPVE